MGFRIGFTLRANPGMVFAADAFAPGQRLGFDSPGDPEKVATVASAKVAPDGLSVDLVIDLEAAPTVALQPYGEN